MSAKPPTVRPRSRRAYLIGAGALFVVCAFTVLSAGFVSNAVAVFLPGDPPYNTGRPQISGTLQVGQTLSCSQGSWTGTEPIDYVYQWNRNGTAISGQTASSYVAQSADVGSNTTCTVTATNDIDSVSATSDPVTVTSGDSGSPSTPPPDSDTSKVELPKSSKAIKFPESKGKRKCVSRRSFRIKIRQYEGITWEKAKIYVNRKSVKVVKGKRLRSWIDLRGLPKGRFTVKVIVWTTDGRKIKGSRKYRTCTKKRKSKKAPKV